MPELTQAQKEAIVSLFTRKRDKYENEYKWISTPSVDITGVAIVQCYYDYNQTHCITIAITPDGGTHS